MDPQQRARPFAICPLPGEQEGPTVPSRGPCRPLLFPWQNEWFQGPLPLVEVQEAKPLGAVRGNAPAFPHVRGPIGRAGPAWHDIPDKRATEGARCDDTDDNGGSSMQI